METEEPKRPWWYKPLRIGGKLTLGFGALVALTLLVVTLALVAGRRATDDIELTEGVRAPAALASAQAQASLLKMQLHVRGYLVASDPLDREHYDGARQQFETSLASLQEMSRGWRGDEAAQWVAELTDGYARWVLLPQQLFELNDNPLKNRPALRLARVEVQARRVQILDGIDTMIAIQRQREPSIPNRELMADLLGFQTSFDAMATNLMAYGASGELNFKLAYGPQLATNATTWNALQARRDLLTAEQRKRLDAIARQRAEVADLALQIVNILNGDRASEALYLYRTEVTPKAQELLGLLGRITGRQQEQLQTGLARARSSLADARLQIGAGGLLALGLGVALVLALRRNLVGPVQRLTASAERVAAGDLSAQAAVGSRDEIGVLATSINTMTQRLAQTIAHLETVIDEAERAKDAAEVASRAKSTFLANMSHELRTPLNAVLGYAQILQGERGLSSRQEVGLDTIRRSGEHLLNLINSMLDLARIEAGKVELYPEAVNLPALVRNVTDIVRANADEKGLALVLDAAPDLPPVVQVDEKRLGQVLLNLLSNAVKFTERGEVRLEVQRLSGDEMGARLRFGVSDTGIGIGADQVARLFQPFEQATDVQRRYGGTGLGLAISRQLVGLMGSDIRVDSEPGRGSRFWFDIELPLAPGEAAAQAPHAQPVAGYQGPRRKVLVIDDVPGNRATMVDFLGPLGFEVHEAENGQVGLERAQELRPDLILMDNVMPVLDGLEATRRLRRMPGFDAVPVIAISASASIADQQASLAGGANAFLPKPVEFDKLLAQIAGLLQLRWIHGPPEPPPVDDDAALLPPPPEEIEVLYRLAQMGNMRNIREHAEHLAALGEAYRPFAQRLRQLADRFQSRRILELVKRTRDRMRAR